MSRSSADAMGFQLDLTYTLRPLGRVRSFRFGSSGSVPPSSICLIDGQTRCQVVTNVLHGAIIGILKEISPEKKDSPTNERSYYQYVTRRFSIF